MDYGVHLDHVEIAGEHESFFGFGLEASGAMLDVPLVGGRLGRRLAGGRGAQADLERAYSGGLYAREALDGPWELVVQARLAQGHDLASEALDDADFVWAK